LQLQKILYIAQMIHLGRFGRRLTDGVFEAWDYGPVEPTVYQKVRMFGSGPIQDVFFDARRFKEDDERREVLKAVCDDLLDKPASTLVEITHWKHGAWAKHYVPGTRGIIIPDDDMRAEYFDRRKSAKLV
jgi:uncharacterized phage-associated protein